MEPYLQGSYDAVIPVREAVLDVVQCGKEEDVIPIPSSTLYANRLVNHAQLRLGSGSVQSRHYDDVERRPTLPTCHPPTHTHRRFTLPCSHPLGPRSARAAVIVD